MVWFGNLADDEGVFDGEVCWVFVEVGHGYLVFVCVIVLRLAELW